jgi:hypothetical protein
MTKDFTPEMEAAISAHVDKWIGIGLSTERADFDAAEAAALACYDLIGCPRPAVVLRMGSPFACVLGGAVAHAVLEDIGYFAERQVGPPVEHQVEHRVAQRVGQQVWRQVGPQVWQQVWKQVAQQVGQQRVVQQVGQQRVVQQIYAQIETKIERRIKQYIQDQFKSKARWKVENEFRLNVLQKVGEQVGRRVEHRAKWQTFTRVVHQVDLFKTVDRHELSNAHYRGSQLWAAWHAYVSFLVEQGLLEPSPAVEAWRLDETLAKTSGFTWWSRDVLSISDRPLFIKRDAEGKLHSDTGNAIEYPDGWGIACWHGVQIPVEWVSGAPPAPVDALALENVDQRRAAIEIIGWRDE